MKFVIQRVKHASVKVDHELKGNIQKGFLVFIGISQDDTKEIADKMVKKMIQLRIFEDEKGKTNLSLADVDGQLLLISQFTLYADCKKGNRPSYFKAAKGEISEPLYNQFCEKLKSILNKEIQKGIFGADMKVSLINDGPVTIWIDSKNKE